MKMENKISKKELNRSIKKMQYYLEFYDNNHFFPFQRKRIDITLSVETINKLKKIKNRSRFIGEAIKEKLSKK